MSQLSAHSRAALAGLGVLAQPAEAVLDALIASVEADERILGALVGGSVATGEADALSDLDVTLVSTEDGLRGVLEEMPSRARAIGPLLTLFSGDHVAVPELMICLYGPPPLHVDLKCVTARDVSERFEELEVLWQRDATLDQILRESSVRAPRPDCQWIEDRFWTWIHYGATKAARGEYLECIETLSLIRKLALGPLIAVAFGQPAAGVRRIEIYARQHAAALDSTVGAPDRETCISALLFACEHYRALRESSTDRVVRRSEAEAAVSDYLSSLKRRPGS